MNIQQRLIPKKFTKTRPGLAMTPTYITIHETDNPGQKANAEAHARLQESGNSRGASWQYQVDDERVIQSIPDKEVAWAAGDGYNGPGNRTSIHVEICVNRDGDYKKAVKLAAQLVKSLMAEHKIPIKRVVQHNHWSGKNCPRHLRAGDKGINWKGFLTLLNPPKPAPKTYLIKKGDNFWVLEERWKIKHGVLQKLNPKVDPDKLRVGQKIIIG